LGRRETEEFLAVWAELEVFWVIGFPKGGSEKGSSREYTEKWVTSWRNLFWGNFRGFTLICEENLFGGI
jgi:hypothetical protein